MEETHTFWVPIMCYFLIVSVTGCQNKTNHPKLSLKTKIFQLLDLTSQLGAPSSLG